VFDKKKKENNPFLFLPKRGSAKNAKKQKSFLTHAFVSRVVVLFKSNNEPSVLLCKKEIEEKRKYFFFPFSFF
jgi:hypothetical protein